MSSNLANTATLVGDATFAGRVTAAMIENAKAEVAATTGATLPEQEANRGLAHAVLYDASSYARLFTQLCADDATISQQSSQAGVADADIRRVVTALWTDAATVVPNLRS